MRRFLPYVWVLVGIAAIAVGAVYFQKRKAAQAVPKFDTVKVERKDIVVSVTAVGVLEPLTTVDVKANVAGEIVELAVDRGDRVMRGDLIARIDPTETQSAYDQAAADVASAQAKIRESQAELDRQSRLQPAQVSSAGEGVKTAQTKVSQAIANLDYQIAVTQSTIKQRQEAIRTAEANVRQAQAAADAQPTVTQASIRQAKAQLEAAKQGLGKLKNATHPQERANAKSDLQASKVNLDNQTKALERLRTLNARGGVSLQEVEDAERTTADAQDRYAQAQAAMDSLQERQSAELREAEANLEQAEAGVDKADAGQSEVVVAKEKLASARAGLKESEAALEAAIAARAQDVVKLEDLKAARAGVGQARSDVQVARANTAQIRTAAQQVAQARASAKRSEASLDNARKNLTYTTIVAPRDGVVIDRTVEEGSVITSGRSNMNSGTSIVMLADESRMFVLAEVDEADIGQVKVGQDAEIEVETFRDRKFKGKVTEVYPKGEEIENVTIFHVRVEVEAEEELLRTGMTAEVNIITARKDNVLALPSDAVFEQEGKSVVEVPKGDKAEQVPVKKGLSNFEWTEVGPPLKEGDEVIAVAGAGMVNGKGGKGGKGGPSSQMKMGGMMKMGMGKR